MRDACNCIADVDRLPSMVDANTRVLVPRFAPPRAFVQTTTAKKIRGRKPPVVAAAFCPFCGVEYPEAPSSMRCGDASLDRVACDADEVRHG